MSKSFQQGRPQECWRCCCVMADGKSDLRPARGRCPEAGLPPTPNFSPATECSLPVPTSSRPHHTTDSLSNSYHSASYGQDTTTPSLMVIPHLVRTPLAEDAYASNHSILIYSFPSYLPLCTISIFILVYHSASPSGD